MKKMFVLAVIMLVYLTGNQVRAQEIPTVATDVSPMLVGEIIPDVTLTDTENNSVSLYSLIGNKPTVIVFYRGDWCFNCTNHFKAEFLPNLGEIARMGYNLIAISPDAPTSLLVTSKESGIDAKYFYGDGSQGLSKAMGLAWKQQERMTTRLTESSGGKNTEMLLPVPAVYVIEPAEKKILFTDIRPLAIPSAARIPWRLLGPVLQALK